MESVKLYFLYDEKGYFIGDGLTKTENSTEVRPPQPCWKPRFNGTEWIETATTEEMNPVIVLPEPPIEKRVEMLENTIMDLLLNGVS